MNNNVDMVRSDKNLIEDKLFELAPPDYEIDGDKVDMTLDDFAYLATMFGLTYDQLIEQVNGQEWLKSI